MRKLVARFESAISGVLSGWDRLVMRAHLISLIRPLGMEALLRRVGVTAFGFGDYAEQVTRRVREDADERTRCSGRPSQYLDSANVDKEKLVKTLLERSPVKEGLVCTLTTLEPCMSFQYHRSRDLRERGLKYQQRKCLHIYRYFRHPELGLIGTRLQSWFPFTVQIWLNGRERLATDLDKHGIEYRRDDNCFTWLSDPDSAQRLMNQHLETNWVEVLGSILRTIHPLHESIFEACPQQYYWSIHQSEFATDYLFTDPEALARVFVRLSDHAIHTFSSDHVLRFLSNHPVHHNYKGEVLSTRKRRIEGVCVKHWAQGNSIKMYDKAGSVLRIETTINNTKPFKSFRPATNDPSGPASWKAMRKGIADTYRRAQVAQAANDRYADALASVEDSQPLHQIFDAVSKALTHGSRPTRALRIGDAHDLALLQAISRGEFSVNGFRNRDLRQILCTPALCPELVRKQSARITRQIRILRDHGLVCKVNKTHRYTLTDAGRQLTAALFAARRATTAQILRAAA